VSAAAPVLNPLCAPTATLTPSTVEPEKILHYLKLDMEILYSSRDIYSGTCVPL
jgi:hypothetical protein